MKNIDLEPPGVQQEVPLLRLIPNTNRNRYFYQNGLAKWIPKLKLKVHSDMEECYALWDKFSPKKSLFDLWDFRFSWYEGYKYRPYFYTLYEGVKPLGVLPVWYRPEKKRYEWFGSNWMEDCSFFVRDPKFIDLFLAVAPMPYHLNALGEHDAKRVKKLGKLTDDDPKNIKNISPFKSMEELLLSFDKKHRYNLKADYLRVLEMNPNIVRSTGKRVNLMDILIEMNIAQFDTGDPEDESDLVLPERAETYRSIVRNEGIYKVHFIQVFIQSHLAAIDFIIQYKDIYYSIKGGNDVKRFRGIGNFVIYYEFKDAVKNKFSLIDCLQIDYGWKHRFFDQTPTFLLEK